VIGCHELGHLGLEISQTLLKATGVDHDLSQHGVAGAIPEALGSVSVLAGHDNGNSSWILHESSVTLVDVAANTIVEA
jgi:hypothetical protein